MDTSKLDAKTMKIDGEQLTVVRWTMDNDGEPTSPIALGKFTYMSDAIAFAEAMAVRSDTQYVSDFALTFTIYNAKGWAQYTFGNKAHEALSEKLHREFIDFLYKSI